MARIVPAFGEIAWKFLVPGPLQRRFQFPPLALPAIVFDPCLLLDGAAFDLDRGGPLRVLAFGRVERGLRLVDGLPPALSIFMLIPWSRSNVLAPTFMKI